MRRSSSDPQVQAARPGVGGECLILKSYRSISVREGFGAYIINRSVVKILVCVSSPSSYILTSIGVSSLIWGIFSRFSRRLELRLGISQTQPVHLQPAAGSPRSLFFLGSSSLEIHSGAYIFLSLG